MLGLWLRNGALKRVDDLPLPEPAAGEARIRVIRAGICGTDLELTRGYSSFSGIPGHEFVGVVEVGAPEWIGRRVVGEINAACGRCEACSAGLAAHCRGRTVLGIAGRNGAFAEFLTLPTANLHPVPDSVETDVAVFTEPLAAALRIREQIAGKGRALVVGDGRLGQLVAQVLSLDGADPVAAGRHTSKLALLAARGIRTCRPEEIPTASFDFAVECTGNADGFALARRALRPLGTLVMKSTYAGALSIDGSALVVDEITLIGSRCGPFAPALRLLAEGKVEVAPLIHARYPLGDGLAAFERAAQPGVLKVLIDPGGSEGGATGSRSRAASLHRRR